MYTIEKTKRQGDILFMKVEMKEFDYDIFGLSLPARGLGDNVIDASAVVLAEGETTGHMHRVVDTAPLTAAAVFGDLATLNPHHRWLAPPSRDMLRRVFGRVGDGLDPEQLLGVLVVGEESEAEIVHEEHDAVTLEPGTWVVIRQRQWSALDNRSIAAYD